MNQDGYINILGDVMLPLCRLKHAAAMALLTISEAYAAIKVKNCFSTKKVNVMECPAQSPDLNPTENLWNDVKAMLYCCRP